MSYTHFDDQHDYGKLTEFCKRLGGEVQIQTGHEFSIFQDRTHISWGQQWKKRIEDSINAATFLIPIITPSFLNSEACRDEIKLFLEREKFLGRDDLILPVYYVDCPILKDEKELEDDPIAKIIASGQYSDWRKIRFDPLDSPPMRKVLETMAKQIVEALKRDQVAPPTPIPSAIPKIPTDTPNNIPYLPKGDRVINRKLNLDRVRNQLKKGQCTAIGHAASFHGMGGLGKTQLAVEYAHEYKNEYPDGVFWLMADQDIKSQIITLGMAVGWTTPDTDTTLVFDMALHRLKSCNDCLLIFDNVDDYATIKDYIPQNLRTHVLITSRTTQPGFAEIELDTLNPELSMVLLCSEASRTPHGQEEEKAAKEISEILGGLPLALELAGAYLREKKLVKFSDYLAKLKTDPVKALEYKKLLSFTKHGPDLYSTLKVNEELFNDEDGLLLRDILDLLAWSSPAHMGLSLMGKLLGKDESELRAALSIGCNYRMLYQEQNLERYGIHRLVREVRRIEVPLAERVGWVDDICQRMGD